ncbi:MAG: hypothetical protein GY855_13030 [candidate division Zixibacteria bacterium]|nr:hypothetical protein [candidate division Zixibacteria bacterium]
MIDISKRFLNSSVLTGVILVAVFVMFGACSDKKGTDSNDEVINRILIDEFTDWSSTDWIVFNHTRKDTTDSLISGLYLVKPDGSGFRFLFAGRFIAYPSFSPKGQWITFSYSGQIWKISFDGTQFNTLTEKGSYFPSAWSPEENRIAYNLRGGDSSGIWIMDSDGGNRRRIIPYGGYPDWLYPDSILYANYDWAHPIGALCIADTSGRFARIIFDPTGNFAYSYMGNDVHREKRIIVFDPQVPGEFADIWIINLDGTGLQRITDFGALHPSFSPDGNRIVYTDSRNGYLWTMNLDGSDKKQITGIQ